MVIFFMDDITVFFTHDGYVKGIMNKPDMEGFFEKLEELCNKHHFGMFKGTIDESLKWLNSIKGMVANGNVKPMPKKKEIEKVICVRCSEEILHSRMLYGELFYMCGACGGGQR